MKPGTPKTLIEAINNGLSESDVIDANKIAAHIIDYLAQKFSVAYLNVANEKEAERLEKLWKSIY